MISRALKSFTFLLAGFWLLTGCSDTRPNEQEAINSGAIESQISFLDSGSFDNSLSRAMKVELETVEVIPLATISVNELPPRLNKWLTTVSDTGGTVTIAPKTRMIGSIISFMVEGFHYLKERMLYAPAKHYNAVVNFDPESGRVKKIIFQRKVLDID